MRTPATHRVLRASPCSMLPHYTTPTTAQGPPLLPRAALPTGTNCHKLNMIRQHTFVRGELWRLEPSQSPWAQLSMPARTLFLQTLWGDGVKLFPVSGGFLDTLVSDLLSHRPLASIITPLNTSFDPCDPRGPTQLIWDLNSATSTNSLWSCQVAFSSTDICGDGEDCHPAYTEYISSLKDKHCKNTLINNYMQWTYETGQRELKMKKASVSLLFSKVRLVQT